MNKIVTTLAAKYKLDEEVIERIIRSEFEFVRDTAEMGLFQSIRLHHLGVFGVKPKRLETLNGYSNISSCIIDAASVS